MNIYKILLYFTLLVNLQAQDKPANVSKEVEAIITKAIIEKDFELAKQKLSELTKEQLHSSIQMLKLLAVVELQQGNVDKALELYGEMLDKGDRDALRNIVSLKIKLNDYEWLEVNKEKILDGIKNDIQIVHAICVWAMKIKSLSLFEECLSKVSDEELIKTPNVGLVVLKTHRFILTQVLEENRQKRKAKELE